MVSSEQHGKTLNRQANIVALPPFVIKIVDGKITLPLTGWRKEMDMEVKSKSHRKDLPTEILLPVKHHNQWLLLIWDLQEKKRFSMIFKTSTLTEGQRETLMKLDQAVINIANYYLSKPNDPAKPMKENW